MNVGRRPSGQQWFVYKLGIEEQLRKKREENLLKREKIWQKHKLEEEELSDFDEEEVEEEEAGSGEDEEAEEKIPEGGDDGSSAANDACETDKDQDDLSLHLSLSQSVSQSLASLHNDSVKGDSLHDELSSSGQDQDEEQKDDSDKERAEVSAANEKILEALREMSAPMEDVDWTVDASGTEPSMEDASLDLHLYLPDTLSQLDDSQTAVGEPFFRFPETPTTSKKERKTISKSPSPEPPTELLDLCSGNFAVRDASEEVKPPSDEQAIEKKEEVGSGAVLDEEEEEVVWRPKKRRRIQSEGEEEEAEPWEDEEEEEESDEELESSDDEVAVVRRLEAAATPEDEDGLTSLKRLGREFFDEEAELSGSDVGSDDEDLGSEADEMETEDGDLDDLPSEQELQNQVGKFFLKQQMDDDRRKLLLYKDKFLEDGEMHSELANRQFRWRYAGGRVDGGMEEAGVEVGEAAAEVAPEPEETLSEEQLDFIKWRGLQTDKRENESDGEMEDEWTKCASASASVLSQSTERVEKCQTSFVSLFTASSETPVFRRDSLLRMESSVLAKVSSGVGGAVDVQKVSGLFTPISSGTNEGKRGKKRSRHQNSSVSSDVVTKDSNENSNSIFDLIVN